MIYVDIKVIKNEGRNSDGKSDYELGVKVFMKWFRDLKTFEFGSGVR